MITRIFIGYASVAVKNLGKDILITDVGEMENLMSSEINFRKLSALNATEVLITQKDEERVFLVADDSAKLSWRNNEFQEPTLTRESTVRRETLSGESHGDREEFQPEETKDDEGINKDFGLTQKLGNNFIYLSSSYLN